MSADTEPHDVAQDATQGEIDTVLGMFKYTVYHDNCYFVSESSTINRVEYRITFRLMLVDGKWAYVPSSNNGYLSVKRKNWVTYGQSTGSDASYEKVRETLIPFLCCWLQANPTMLEAGKHKYIAACKEKLRDYINDLEAKLTEAVDDLQVLTIAKSEFDRRQEPNWNIVEAIDRKERRTY